MSGNNAKERPLYVVRRVRKVAGGHHGGAWKVAYADFVTAMMAFFLVMWLVGIASKNEKAAISEYFRNPSAVVGKAIQPGASTLGPGGADRSMIPTANAMPVPGGVGPDLGHQTVQEVRVALAKRDAKAEEERQHDALRRELEAAVQSSQALAPFKDQLLIDLTPEGLRVQIVDKLNRPMFDLGSVVLKPYARDLLHELGRLLAARPNRIALSGHTDEVPFQAPDGYGNWELSSDRANAARRALLQGGLGEERIARVVGLAASVPFDKAHPRDPVNRRISIVVLDDGAYDAMVARQAGGATSVVRAQLVAGANADSARAAAR